MSEPISCVGLATRPLGSHHLLFPAFWSPEINKACAGMKLPFKLVIQQTGFKQSVLRQRTGCTWLQVPYGFRAPLLKAFSRVQDVRAFPSQCHPCTSDVCTARWQGLQGWPLVLSGLAKPQRHSLCMQEGRHAHCRSICCLSFQQQIVSPNAAAVM